LASKIHAVVDTNSPIREVEPLRASSPDVRLWGRSGHAWTGGQVEVYLPVGDVNAPPTLPCNAPRIRSTPAHNGATTEFYGLAIVAKVVERP
jgi:hypothetical protein